MNRADPVRSFAPFNEKNFFKTGKGCCDLCRTAAGLFGNHPDILIRFVCQEMIDLPVQILFLHLYTFHLVPDYRFCSCRTRERG